MSDMTPDLITRVVGLLEKNGDRIVLADPTSGRAVVVIDLNTYEQLLAGLSPQQQPALFGAVQPNLAAPQPVYQPAAYTPAPLPVQMPAPVAPPAPAPMPTPAPAPAIEPAYHPAVVEGAVDAFDMTQEDLINKINREISAWKDAQESKRTQELMSAVKPTSSAKNGSNRVNSTPKPTPAPKAKVTAHFEEEERFYLEPIE